MQNQDIEQTGRPERAGRYQRVSKSLQKSKGYGMLAQEDGGDVYIAARGYSVVGDWDDTDSGADWELPGLNAMLDMAAKGAFTVLVVPEPDRFARDMTKQLIIEAELKKLGVRVEYARYRLDTNTAEGRLLKNQLASFAEFECEKIAFRTGRGRYKKAQLGIVVGVGRPPYGYRYHYNADGKVDGLEEEKQPADVVRRIVAECAEHSAASVAAALTAEGIAAPHAHEAPRRAGALTQRGRPRTRGGLTGRWTEGTLRGIIANPVYTGTAVFGRRDERGRLRPDAAWLRASVPALVTPEAVAAARAGMAARRNAGRRKAEGAPDRFGLRGRLRCALCGGAMACVTKTAQGERYSYYRCLRALKSWARRYGAAPCAGGNVLAAELDGAVWRSVAAWMLDPARFEAGVAAALAGQADADARRAGRLAVVDAAITAAKGQLVALSLDAARAESEGSAAVAAALRETRAKVERELDGHERGRTRLAAPAPDSLAPAAVAAVRAFAATHGAALTDEATAAERATIIAALSLTVSVRPAAEGEAGLKLTARSRPVVVTWRGAPGVEGVVNSTLAFVDTNVGNRVREVRLSFLAG